MQLINLRIKRLLIEYVQGTIQPIDRDELFAYLNEASHDQELDAILAELFDEMEVEPSLIIQSDRIYQELVTHAEFNDFRNSAKRKYLWWSVGAAAAIMLVLFKIFLFSEASLDEVQHSTVTLVQHAQTNQVIGEKKAVLRLADGTEIDLDDAENGIIALENNMKISLEGSTINYERNQWASLDDSMAMNTISTTNGRQFQVVLPDGTNIWLNALSSITYPVRFDPQFREVEITGEAYFEVEKAKNWPFIVKTSTQEIRVLGTHFNISAYPDDRVYKTTLVEGSLKVTAFNKDKDSSRSEPKDRRNSMVLKPGQQAITYKENEKLAIKEVDSDEVISWKNNVFVFNNEEVKLGMKKVMRWYDVDIVYKDRMEGIRIGGTIPRFAKIEQLMDALENTGLFHYKMEGGKVVIMK